MSRVANKLIAAAAGAGGDVDSQFEKVVLQLDGDGTNGADNNDLDRAAGSGSINYNQSVSDGNVEQGSFSPHGDNWSVYFDGGSDQVNVPDSNGLDFGTGTFTVELWFYIVSHNSNDGIIAKGGTGAGWQIIVGNTNNQLKFIRTSGSASSPQITSGDVDLGEWYHLALTRDSSNDVRLFLNGTQEGTYSDSTSWDTSTDLRIGTNRSQNNDFHGYISNVRVIKGTALYTADFTPPTSPLSAVTNTNLLTSQSNKFVDNSSTAASLTVGGSPKVMPFSPFKPDEAKTSTNHGGSFRFTDYASQNRSRNGTYTFEAWVYWVSISGYEGIICFGDYSVAGGTYFYRQGTDVKIYHANSLTASYNVGFKNNEWRYLTLMNTGSTHYVWVDGEYQGSSSGSTSASYYYHFAGYYSGALDSGAISNVIVSDMRLVNAAIYNTAGNDITVPTAPLTTHASIDWLYNYGADAGFYDLSGLNLIRSKGNAQIDTAVKKYGTGSMQFDESGDYLAVTQSEEMVFGTGDFTIEGWLYIGTNPVSNGQGMFQISNGYLNSAVRGPAVGLNNADGKWAIYYGTSQQTATAAAPSINTWYHVAYVRNSSTTKLYIDGTELISVSDSTNYSNKYLTIGGWYSTSYLLNGFIDDFRITRGVARYTANFTPPTEALPKF